jgi:hypothetical protein
MGLPPILEREEPEILAIYKSLLEQVSRRGLVAGIQNASRGWRPQHPYGAYLTLSKIRSMCRPRY